MRLSHRILVVIAVTALFAIGAALGLATFMQRGASMTAVAAAAILMTVPIVLWSSHVIRRRISELHDDLGNALRATRDGDHSLRLVVRGDREIAELKRLYNELADAIHTDRHAILGKEVLLDTILQRTPIGVVLVNAANRVIYSNAAARELVAGGSRVDGKPLEEIAERVDPALRELLASGTDAIFRAADETFHLTQRLFRLHTQQHRLILLERLTPELHRQEIGVWKKAIRLINHEINNSIAPISSLFHSARVAQENPEHQHRVAEIYGLIEERLGSLRDFLDAYAQFARLPGPRKERVAWEEVLAPVRTLYPFRTAGRPDLEASLDRAQMQHVLINLVKNAHESGSDPGEVLVSVEKGSSDTVLRVLDRGRGMPDEVLRQALVPFYSTKPGGTGLGLALCNDIVEGHGGRMRVAARDGGGTVVTCWLPAAPSD